MAEAGSCAENRVSSVTSRILTVKSDLDGFIVVSFSPM
jgi:hypothetical protein